MAQALQRILVYLDSLEHCFQERISDARRHVIELLASCQPNGTMGRDSHYIIAPFETLVDPSLDPAFSGLPPEGTGPLRAGLLLSPQRQFAIGLGFGLIASNAPVIADDGPVAQSA